MKYLVSYFDFSHLSAYSLYNLPLCARAFRKVSVYVSYFVFDVFYLRFL